MLWYEDIYVDVAQEYRVRGIRRALELLKRGLAFNLRHHEGNDADKFLRDLAETHLWLGDLGLGLTILSALLRNDPSDIWTHNVIALTFGHFGLADLASEVTQRGLEVIEATGNPEGLRSQFARSRDRLRESERRGREAEVAPAVLADFHASLALDVEAVQHRPVTELLFTPEALLHVAQAAEADHPRAALEIYRSRAERAIAARGQANYQSAAEHLLRVRALHRRLGAEGTWSTYIAHLRQDNRRPYALFAELGTGGL